MSSVPTNRPIRIGVLSDLHLAAPTSQDGHFHNVLPLGRSRELFEWGLEQIRNAVDVIVILGDLSDQARAGDYVYMLDRLEKTRTPTYLVHGNHDLPPQLRSQSRSNLSHALRSAPSSSVHELASTMIQFGPVSMTSFPLGTDGADYRINLDEQSATMLRDEPLVFVSHFPVISRADTCIEVGWPYAGDMANRQSALDLLHAESAPRIVFSGHLHLRGHSISRNILQLHFAALIEPPHDASILTITREPDDTLFLRRSDLSFAAETVNSPILDPAHTAFSWKDEVWQFH